MQDWHNQQIQAMLEGTNPLHHTNSAQAASEFERNLFQPGTPMLLPQQNGARINLMNRPWTTSDRQRTFG